MSPRFRGRVRRGGGDAPQPETTVVEIDPGQLRGLFAAPGWLRDMGIAAWLLVGVFLLVGGLVWLLSLTYTIVAPVVVAGILAAVLGPLVGLLERHRLPRGAGAAIVFLLVAALALLFGVLILSSISSETASVTAHLQGAAKEIEGWLRDLGVDTGKAANANADASSSASDGFHALVNGLRTGIGALAGLVIFLSFTALSLFFLLKDGPRIMTWAERHAGVPPAVASTIFQRTAGALRGYFLGVTAVAAFNGILIGLGALVFGVPLAGTIAVMNFAAAYIPYLGAWTAGIATVLIALGAEGTSAAIPMAILVLLANGALQQMIQPIAYGATLGIHPLAVLIVTIAAGSIFGMLGLVLAAPVTSAIVKISGDLARARASEDAQTGDASPGTPGTPPPSGASPAPAPGYRFSEAHPVTHRAGPGTSDVCRMPA